MPNAQTIEAKNFMLFYGSSTKKACAHANDLSLSITHASKEISSKDSGFWSDLAKGKLKWSAGSGGLMTIDANTQSFEFLFDAIISRELVTLTFALASGTGPAWTADTSKDIYIGTAFIDSLDANAPTDGEVTYTVKFSGSGPLNKTNAV